MAVVSVLKGARDCSSCERLNECTEVTEQRILDNYVCDMWLRASDAELDARADITHDLGLWALRYETLASKIQSARPKRSRRRKNNV